VDFASSASHCRFTLKQAAASGHLGAQKIRVAALIPTQTLRNAKNSY